MKKCNCTIFYTFQNDNGGSFNANLVGIHKKICNDIITYTHKMIKWYSLDVLIYSIISEIIFCQQWIFQFNASGKRKNPNISNFKKFKQC